MRLGKQAAMAIPKRLAWYHEVYDSRESKSAEEDGLLALRGSGKELWADEPADEYVLRLREG